MQQHPSTRPEENDEFSGLDRSWVRRFGNACRGIKLAIRAEASFFIHLFVTVIVVLAGGVLGISRIEWCLVMLCVAAVLSAELINTAIERLAKAITQEINRDIRDALDMASGAVLVVALAAAGVGIVVLGRPLLQFLS